MGCRDDLSVAVVDVYDKAIQGCSEICPNASTLLSFPYLENETALNKLIEIDIDRAA